MHIKSCSPKTDTQPSSCTHTDNLLVEDQACGDVCWIHYDMDQQKTAHMHLDVLTPSLQHSVTKKYMNTNEHAMKHTENDRRDWETHYYLSRHRVNWKERELACVIANSPNVQFPTNARCQNCFCLELLAYHQQRFGMTQPWLILSCVAHNNNS